ncbi:glycosyltransferase family 4 protein [Stackebrandtia soli]|uniref:glycosyltransferase family 4 protein n=1 Tax=Stackebrandtia soli TaxID=1892856 RepID=UPI0039E8815A
MRIGIVSPYSFSVPGGVQGHIRDLAQTLIGLGHHVSVLAPAEHDDELPPFVVPAGRAIPVPYNGSVARLSFGPISASRVRRWIKHGAFDVLHVHEPLSPSLSLLACAASSGPVVATFHTAITRSRTLLAGKGVAQLVLERIAARIAVSASARRVQVEHLGGGAVEIPNGVIVDQFAAAEPLDGWPGPDGAIGFVGRFTEPRKGFPILCDAFVALARSRPGLRLLVLGPGEQAEALRGVPPDVAQRIVFLGMADDVTKARMLRSVTAYIAPNTGGESFGMILTEAMSAGTPVIASDIDAFRRVLADGTAGALFPVGDATALADTIDALLSDPQRMAGLVARADEIVTDYDWRFVAEWVLDVYHAAIEATGSAVTAGDTELSRQLETT